MSVAAGDIIVADDFNQPICLGEDIKTSADESVAAGTAEVVQNLTFDAVSGDTYTAYWETDYVGNTLSNAAIASFRKRSGAGPVVVGDSSFGGRFVSTARVTTQCPIVLSANFVATATGTYTIGVVWNFFSGAGTMTVGGSANSPGVLRVTQAVRV